MIVQKANPCSVLVEQGCARWMIIAIALRHADSSRPCLAIQTLSPVAPTIIFFMEMSYPG